MFYYLQKDIITLRQIRPGTNLAQRTLLLSRDGLLGGLVMGMFDCWMGKSFSNFLQIGNRCAYWMVPCAAMGTAYAFATDIACNLRGKADNFNDVIGAIPVTYIVYRWNKSISRTSGFLGLAVIVLGISAANPYKNRSWDPRVKTTKSVLLGENYYIGPDGTRRLHWEM